MAQASVVPAVAAAESMAQAAHGPARLASGRRWSTIDNTRTVAAPSRSNRRASAPAISQPLPAKALKLLGVSKSAIPQDKAWRRLGLKSQRELLSPSPALALLSSKNSPHSPDADSASVVWAMSGPPHKRGHGHRHAHRSPWDQASSSSLQTSSTHGTPGPSRAAVYLDGPCEMGQAAVTRRKPWWRRVLGQMACTSAASVAPQP